MFCGKDGAISFGRRRRKMFERTMDFLHSPPQAKTILFFGGLKMDQYIYIFYTAADGKPLFFFLGGGGVKMVSYIYTHFLHILPQAKTFWVFGG
jgi:hypothetical protein